MDEFTDRHRDRSRFYVRLFINILQTCCGSIERRKLTRSLQLQRSRPNQLAPIAASLTQITKMSYAG